MKKAEFNFLQDHSMHYLEMALSADRREKIQNPDGYGKNVRGCGDTVEFFLTLQNNIIRSVSFMVDGCINTNACANTVAHFAEGKTLEQAWEITPDMVVDYLQTLPEESKHCAELSVGAFYKALADCRENMRHPWKKLYSIH